MHRALAERAGPDPRRVTSMAGLVRELGLLRARAAYGTRKTQVSLAELAHRIGEPKSTVHAYVTGKHLAAPDVFDRMVIALGVAPAEQREWTEAWFRVSAQLSEQRRYQRGLARHDVHGPCQLPPDVPGFTGRQGELVLLDRMAIAPTPAVAALTGTCGVGKTALAVHWAHRARADFPDGQLWVDLRGYDPGRPRAVGAVMARVLRAVGVDRGSLPADLDERAARYRSALAGRRLILLLDNARDSEHVRQLLPGTPTCLVLITSRDSLAGLIARDGARRVPVEPLPVEDSAALVAGLAGHPVDTRSAASVAELCARLPLALRVAAALAATRPGGFAELAAELADVRRRLDLLDTGDDSRTGLRSVFSWSYRALDAATARTFRMLGLHPGPHIDTGTTAALTGVGSEQASRSLVRLSRAHLIREAGGGRFAMHCLLRSWAAEIGRAIDSQHDRAAALTRLRNCLTQR